MSTGDPNISFSQRTCALIPFLLCFLFLFAHLNSTAQNGPVSVSADKQPLSVVISRLASTYQLQFAYSTDQVNLDQKISAELAAVSLDAALKKILSNTGISYSINGSQVILFKDPNQRYTISGRIREKGTGELLIGVIVSTLPAKAGAISNGYGFYSITLPADTYTIQFNYIGFKPMIKKFQVNQSADMDIELEAASKLDEIVISEEAIKKELALNAIQIPLKEIADVPMILGEKDALKYIMLMPGLQKGNEGNSYMYVRGGGPDQNLILIDDAVIYNAYHYLGLASLFSGNELRNAELIKGGFSSKYGGRLSSILNMSMKDGNREKYGAEATIGIISSRIMVEGPVQKGKSSFFISARKSYIDKVSQLLVQNEDEQLNYGYYDIHAKISTDLGAKDRLMLSGYIGHDMLFTNGGDQKLAGHEDGISWGNRAATIRWNHQYSGKLFSNTSLVYSYYRSRIALSQYSAGPGIYTSGLQSSINDYTAKYDLDYLPSGFSRIKAGAGFTRHRFQPVTSFVQDTPAFNQVKDDAYFANEGFAYGEYSMRFASGLRIIPGIRISYYSNQTSYIRAEPRLNMIYPMKKNWSINASYDLMNQYVHLISSFNGLGFPSDIWTSSDALLKPQRAQLISAGISKNHIRNSAFSFAIEAYYKHIQNIAIMKEGSAFLQLLPASYFQPAVQNWNDLLTQGTSISYGTEIQLKKEGKHFSGWVSYTLSKTTIQAPELNRGRAYSATYDRRHDLGIYTRYKTTRHFIFSASWIYGTGNAISLPVGEYFVPQQIGGLSSQTLARVSDYEQKNNYRMKPYHRLDVSMQYVHLIVKRIESTIELSVYNVYNRANPFYYQIINKNPSDPSSARAIKQVSLFPAMPSVSWTIKF